MTSTMNPNDTLARRVQPGESRPPGTRDARVEAARPRPAPAISWAAVFSGCVLSLVAYLFLSILGTAVGASAVDPTGDANPLSGFGTGAGIWLVMSTIIAICVGALVAGRSAPAQGGLHGVLSWSVTTLVTTFLLASAASGLVGTAFGVVGKGLSLAGQGVAAASPGIASQVGDELRDRGVDLDWDNLRGEFETLLAQSGKAELSPDAIEQKAEAVSTDGEQSARQALEDPTQSGDALADWFERARREGRTTLEAADREALVNIVVARTGKPRAEAEQIVARYQQQAQAMVARFDALKAEAEQKAREASDAAARGVSKAAWTAVVLLILGGAISWFAGAIGFRRRMLHAAY
ncbi:MAG: hypothetical protein ACJ8GV_06780 [Luteimonas sp.]